MNSKIQESSYMNAYKVHDYLDSHFLVYEQEGHHVRLLSDICKHTCPIHVNLRGVFYSVNDLQTVIPPDEFRKMECEVVTYMLCYN
jgi:hypothetical protein